MLFPPNIQPFSSSRTRPVMDAETTSVDAPPTLQSSPALQGEAVVFTGTLASMTHQQAFEYVTKNGGTAGTSVSRNTTMLVVGEEGWPLESDGATSHKLRQTDELNQAGHDIRIVSESDWLHLIGLDERREEVHRTYTPAMLSSLLDIPVSLIRRWERLGLIRPVRRVCRLPYFDFQEVTGVRKLSDLLAAGVEPEQLERQLGQIGRLVDGSDRSIAQLNILVRDSRVVCRDRFGLVQPSTGQRILDFESDPDEIDTGTDAEPSRPIRFAQSEIDDCDDDHMRWSAAQWFDEGCRRVDVDETVAAIEAFRLCLTAAVQSGATVDAGDEPVTLDLPTVNFHLAEALYRSGNVGGAIERYYVAIENDPNFLEAWTQLGCVLCEAGRTVEALDAFQIALDVHPEYPDANLHIADLMHSLGRTEDAVPHWRTYLEFDQRGPWADHARECLDAALAGS